MEIGRHWTLDYSPLWTIYSNNQFSDNFGQVIKLLGGATYNDWVLGLIQSYSDIFALSAETASQTRTETYNTALNGSYTMNSKMSLTWRQIRTSFRQINFQVTRNGQR